MSEYPRTKPMDEIMHESCILASMIEGLDAMYEAADGPEECPLAKRARNGMRPMIDAAIEKAWKLNDMIETTERAARG